MERRLSRAERLGQIAGGGPAAAGCSTANRPAAGCSPHAAVHADDDERPNRENHPSRSDPMTWRVETRRLQHRQTRQRPPAAVGRCLSGPSFQRQAGHSGASGTAAGSAGGQPGGGRSGTPRVGRRCEVHRSGDCSSCGERHARGMASHRAGGRRTTRYARQSGRNHRGGQGAAGSAVTGE